MLTFTALSVFIAVGMGVFSKWKVSAWQKRDFGDRDFKWNLLIGISAGSSVLFSQLAFALSADPWVSLCIGMVGFLVVLSSVTDFALMKIPSELTTLVQYTPIPFIAMLWPSFDFYDKMSMVMWAGIVLVFAVLSFMRMFGWADVKIMFAFGVTLSWWMGPSFMIYGLLGAAILALAALPFAAKFGYKIKKHLGDGTKWDAEAKKMVAVDRKPVAEEELEGLGRKDSRAVIAKAKGKKKTFLPFGPALLVSFLVTALIAAGTMEINTFTFFDLP